MGTEQLIAELRATLEKQLQRARALRDLPLVLLEQQPAPKKWSVLEICEHMNLSCGHYLIQLRGAYNDKLSSFTHSEVHRPGFWGGMLTNTMQPTDDGRIKLPMPTLRIFEPQRAPMKRLAALDEFIAMLEGFRTLLDVAATRGMEGPRITSTLGPLFRFKVADAFRFAVAHQERHLLQIARTLEVLRA
ncbi:MAG: DinB family protein [Flavobacteriales bacterium]|nr:DinB family protein [Flavobacteriales bacterium]